MKVVKKCLKFGPSKTASTVSNPAVHAYFEGENLTLATPMDASNLNQGTNDVELNNNSIKSSSCFMFPHNNVITDNGAMLSKETTNETSSTNRLNTNYSVGCVGDPIDCVNTNSMPAFGSKKWVTLEPTSQSPGKYGGFLGAMKSPFFFPSFKIGEKDSPGRQLRYSDRKRKPVETYRKGDLPVGSEITMDKEVPRKCTDPTDSFMEVDGCVPLDSLEQQNEEHLKLVEKSHDNSLDSSMETQPSTPKSSAWYRRVFEAGKTLRSWLGSLSPRTKNRKDVQSFSEQLRVGMLSPGESEKSPTTGNGEQESNYATLRGLLQNIKVLWWVKQRGSLACFAVTAKCIPLKLCIRTIDL